MHDPKALSLPNIPEGFIAQQGGMPRSAVTIWQQLSDKYFATQQVASKRFHAQTAAWRGHY